MVGCVVDWAAVTSVDCAFGLAPCGVVFWFCAAVGFAFDFAFCVVRCSVCAGCAPAVTAGESSFLGLFECRGVDLLVCGLGAIGSLSSTGFGASKGVSFGLLKSIHSNVPVKVFHVKVLQDLRNCFLARKVWRS